MCCFPVPQVPSGTESHLSGSRELEDKGLRRGSWKNPWHDPRRRVLLWPNQGCFLWPKARLKSKLSCLFTFPLAHGFDLKQQRGRVGWGRTRTGGVSDKASFLMCRESCLFNILVTQTRKGVTCFLFIFVINNKHLRLSLGACPHPYLPFLLSVSHNILYKPL